MRRTHSHSPSPAPSSTPSLQQHAAPSPNASPGRKNRECPEETGHGERDEQGKIIGQGRPRSPKTVQSAEGGGGKDKRERIIVVVRTPCKENYPADAHPGAHKSVLESANPTWTRSVHLDASGQRHEKKARLWDSQPWGSLTLTLTLTLTSGVVWMLVTKTARKCGPVLRGNKKSGGFIGVPIHVHRCTMPGNNLQQPNP